MREAAAETRTKNWTERRPTSNALFQQLAQALDPLQAQSRFAQPSEEVEFANDSCATGLIELL